MLEQFAKCLPVDIMGIGKGKNGMGKIDLGLMSCHALSPWNVLVKHVRLWGKSNKGKSQTGWGWTKEKEQTFGLQWGLAWKQELIRLFLPADLPLWVKVWFSSGLLRFLVLTTVSALLRLQKDTSILAVSLCLSGGLLNLQKLPQLREGNCPCGTVEGRRVLLVGCPGRKTGDSYLLNLTKF